MMSRFLEVLRADLVLFFRGRVAMFWTIVFPAFLLVMQMALFGRTAALGTVDLAIVDLDQTSASTRFAEYARRALENQAVLKTRVQMLHRPVFGRSEAVLTLKPGFGEAIAESRTGVVTVAIDIAERPRRSAFVGLVRGVTDSFNLDWRPGTRVARLQVEDPTEKSPRSGYIAYLVTGVAGMILLSTGLMGFAPGLVLAREAGTLQMYQLFPLGRQWILVAWWLSKLLVGVVAAGLMFAIAIVVYGLSLDAPLWNLVLAASLLVAGCGAFLSLGLLVAAMSNSVASATVIANLLYFPLLFTGNLFVPLGGLPDALRNAVAYSPLNSLVDAMRGLLAGDPDWALPVQAFAGLGLLTVISLVAAVRRFDWQPRTSE